MPWAISEAKIKDMFIKNIKRKQQSGVQLYSINISYLKYFIMFYF